MNPTASDRLPAVQLGHAFKCVCCGTTQWVPDLTFDAGLRLLKCTNNACFGGADAVVPVWDRIGGGAP